jgi:Bacterial Ig domain
VIYWRNVLCRLRLAVSKWLGQTLLPFYLVIISVTDSAFAQPFTNTVVYQENQKSGTTDWLLTSPATRGEIEGFASLTSVNRGGQIDLLVNTTNSAFVLDVFRIGWYGGAGARRVLGPLTVPGTVQAIPPMDPVTGLVECNWTNPYTLSIPATSGDPTDWASGVYVAKLTGQEDGKQTYIIFAVRDDDRASGLLAQMSVTTYQAYNTWGGASLYTANNPTRPLLKAVKVSFNRPYVAQTNFPAAYWNGSGEFFGKGGGTGWEANLVRWLEREGYDVSYCTSLDTHSNSNLLSNHKAFIAMGHDEYWSYPMRWNIQAARDSGVNLAFLSSNTSWWQVRFEPSTSDGAPARTMVCYKSTHDPVFDTSSNYLTTVNFISYPVLDSPASLIGMAFQDAGLNGDLVVSDPAHWLFANTAVTVGQHLNGLLGYEVDGTNIFSPPGTWVACASPYQIYENPIQYSHAASYRAPSGATVFASGSMEWSWGLDDLNVPRNRNSCENPAVQHMTRNLMAQMLNAPVPTATFFFRMDPLSLGSWKPNYGIDGVILPDDATNLPPYATMSFTGADTATWLASSSDRNCLQRSGSAGQYLAGWSSPTNFSLELELSDNQNHDVAFYVWDWDHAGRSQLVEVVDAVSNTLLDRRTLDGFTNGQWWVWQVHGHVQFRFTNLAGPDCLLSAIAFGGGAQTAFVGEDAVTKGNWKPYYGSDGQYLAGGAQHAPAYGRAFGFGEVFTNWNTTVWDPRPLASYAATSRQFTAWNGGDVMLEVADNAWHQLAIYCVDGDRLERKQCITVVDASNNNVLDSRELSNFGDGRYLVWNFRGSIRLKAQRLSLASAAISGIFFGPPNSPPSVALTSPTNLQTCYLTGNIVLAADAADPDGSVDHVDFYADDKLLGAATNAPFSFTWTNAQVGEPTLRCVAMDDRMAAATSAPVTLFINPPRDYQPPFVEVVSPADSSTFLAPCAVAFSASVTVTSAPIRSVQFLVDGVSFGRLLTNAPFTMLTSNLYAGVHSVRARATDMLGVAVTSSGNRVTVIAPPPRTEFPQSDDEAEGRWRGRYGSEGYLLVNYATNLPPYAVVSPVGSTGLIWTASTSDLRALQKPSGTDRFAAAWLSSSSNYVLDVNLSDGNAHRVELYCVDWSNQGGSQTIQAMDAGTGAVLSTQTLTNFYQGAYTIWDVIGHVQFSFSRAPSSVPAFLSGVFFDPPRATASITTLQPFDGASFASPTSIQMSAYAFSGRTNLSRVEFLVNGTVLGADDSGQPYSFTWTNPAPGNYTLTACAVDAAGAKVFSSPSAITVEAAAAAAVFVLSDTNAQGDWDRKLGLQGYVVAGDSTNLPGYAHLNLSAQLVTWASFTTDPRALDRSSDNSRIAAAWFDYTNVVLDLEFTDANFHRLTLYCLDWYGHDGLQSVDVLDNVSGAVLDHENLPAFSNGLSAVWDLKGHVQLRLTRTGGSPVLVSGIFFDPSGILPAITLLSPAGMVFTAPAQIALTAQAPVDASNVTEVDIYDGLNLLATFTNGPPYAFIWTNAVPGIHSLTAHESGPAGAADSPPLRLTVFSTSSPSFVGANLLPDGSIAFSASGPGGAPIRLEAATNLGPNAVWTPLMTNISGATEFQFIITDAANYPQRFYRMLTLY